MDWQTRIEQAQKQGSYAALIQLLEAEIEQYPDERHLYWQLGLAYLLNEQEEEAQTTWLYALSNAPTDELTGWTQELSTTLTTEAERLEECDEFKLSWLIRQHLRELQPDNLQNLFKLIILGCDHQTLQGETLSEWHLVQLLETQQAQSEADETLFKKALSKLLIYRPGTFDLELLTRAALSYFTQPEVGINTVLQAAFHLAYIAQQSASAVTLLKVCLEVEPQNLECLRQLSTQCTNLGHFSEGIAAAEQLVQLCRGSVFKAIGSYALLRALLSSGGRWASVEVAHLQHCQYLDQIIQDLPRTLPRDQAANLVFANFFAPYLQDTPAQSRPIQNELATISQANLCQLAGMTKSPFTFTVNSNPAKLRIGYIAHTLKAHSVGWLSRWFLSHHQHDSFQIHLYLLRHQDNLFTQEWFIKKADVHHSFSATQTGREIAQAIYDDGIDILVDLDSITLDLTCEVMALKPAPVQVTWLGWDASGLPSIDYFVADPYVLPDDAQNYYQEKIWRLPQTYLAVDGFEIGVPSLRRDQLEIPNDAVVYFSGQRGYKRHPETVRLQCKILREVPNSYLLIKGFAEEATVQKLFSEIATDEEVDPNRLRFLPYASHEFTHRANLQLADVVLDTYPYNGATTSLEALWMGIPLVTRVGQQFAARNSYTFLKNLEISEGIAWSADEYVEWGVRLGVDKDLRENVTWRLLASRQTSPLWNAKQFCRDMEQAYQQMWANYSQKT
ncbi:O-linked N-acetylglucosamine transferase, SPINDLY family protein [Synechococcales cyanobacterium C]|uniref:O-linked N-acetylglucosamine transferase, SPINDLY family protein n=1 Tax=Petrachloros mirabilis ULC683 TaxID=2781853 RepID=A0A8K2A1Q3_9CYAN|nr:O-linked N-acetylglucosamine transferase, SPINDLY family protein [Petrachloros mirabilis]NCJ07877.1 O-linked N-acetylglucosamine transferase, SPINDLY family protein [Petrachloros mirabilis ULC683]